MFGAPPIQVGSHKVSSSISKYSTCPELQQRGDLSKGTVPSLQQTNQPQAGKKIIPCRFSFSYIQKSGKTSLTFQNLLENCKITLSSFFFFFNHQRHLNMGTIKSFTPVSQIAKPNLSVSLYYQLGLLKANSLFTQQAKLNFSKEFSPSLVTVVNFHFAKDTHFVHNFSLHMIR